MLLGPKLNTNKRLSLKDLTNKIGFGLIKEEKKKRLLTKKWKLKMKDIFMREILLNE